VFSSQGAFVRKWGGASGRGDKGDLNGWFNVATGIGIDTEGRVYVADFDNHRIQIFDRKGNFITSFGTRGSGSGEFERPTDVTVDKHGNIIVVDWGNNRIQKFSIEWEK